MRTHYTRCHFVREVKDTNVTEFSVEFGIEENGKQWRVAELTRDRGINQAWPVQINWSAWGAQDIGTTAAFTATMRAVLAYADTAEDELRHDYISPHSCWTEATRMVPAE